MKSALTVALLLGAAVLALWTASELAGQAGVIDAVAPGAPRPLPAARSEAVPGHGQRRAEEVATILSRPLFNASRRPKGAPAAPTQAAGSASTLPRMTAILIDGNARSAIFEGHGKPSVLSEGGHIGPFTIESIEPQQVTIIGPDGKRVVHTSFSAEPPPASRLPPVLPTGGPNTGPNIGSNTGPNTGPPGLPNMGPPR